MPVKGMQNKRQYIGTTQDLGRANSKTQYVENNQKHTLQIMVMCVFFAYFACIIPKNGLKLTVKWWKVERSGTKW